LGLAFKPGTDDMRDAVSIRIVRKLLEEGAKVVVYDPKAMDNAKKIFGENVEYASSVEECLKDSECAIIVTEWDEFRKLKPEDFIRLMRNPVVVDGRRIYDPEVYSRKLKFKAMELSF
jgi:UDPglucose 6-dehydrogenase